MTGRDLVVIWNHITNQQFSNYWPGPIGILADVQNHDMTQNVHYGFLIDSNEHDEGNT